MAPDHPDGTAHGDVPTHGTDRTVIDIHGRPGAAADRARAWAPEVHERPRRAKGAYDPSDLLRFGDTV